MTDNPARYSYFEKDGAYFRRHPGRHGVSDVLHSKGWKPYDGDCWAPVVFGDKVPDPLGGDGSDAERPVTAP